MHRTLTITSYRRLVFITLFALAFIVVTGGAVRLTGSGLGCPDWPTCTRNRLIAPVSYHAMVEFVNRVVTGLVSLAVMVVALGSFFLQERRRDLVWLSLGLVIGLIGQIVLGGITVLFDLAPALVAAHFMLSLVLVADAVVLYQRVCAYESPAPRISVDANTRALTKLMIAATALVVVLGTVVTGSGPHSGDPRAHRFGFVIGDVARLHGIAVMILLALTLYTLYLLREQQQLGAHIHRAEILLAVLVAQMAVGYTQYFTGVPAFLVGIHILGAVSVWIAMLWFALGVLSTPELATMAAQSAVVSP